MVSFLFCFVFLLIFQNISELFLLKYPGTSSWLSFLCKLTDVLLILSIPRALSVIYTLQLILFISSLRLIIWTLKSPELKYSNAKLASSLDYLLDILNMTYLKLDLLVQQTWSSCSFSRFIWWQLCFPVAQAIWFPVFLLYLISNLTTNPVNFQNVYRIWLLFNTHTTSCIQASIIFDLEYCIKFLITVLASGLAPAITVVYSQPDSQRDPINQIMSFFCSKISGDFSLSLNSSQWSVKPLHHCSSQNVVHRLVPQVVTKLRVKV